ncbi:deacylase [Christiangramia fulva]|uniref:Deacylase n=1 Tax=Christiangramia fulva TaxID=2126553 RepID=A0A2R3Z5F7_9FLAO|nr:acyloxyacyl hydrolase [Christiangramia fulva]AVR45495.1 deacylase [Christiangramia fulva]
MKKIAPVFFLLSTLFALGQENEIPKFHSLDANFYYGSIVEHNPDISHLITGHPTGFILTYNRKTYGFEKWERRYNYPDFGFSFIYQDLKNQYLGENMGLYAHMSFYALKRKFMFRIGQGVAYATTPYDQNDNYRNNAYGTHFLSTTYLMGNFKKENIFEGLGVQAGITLIHYSNADLGSPNHSTNTFTFNLGLNYMLEHEDIPNYIPRGPKEKYTEPVHYNFALRGGVNTTGVVGSPQLPFFTIAAYADKVLNHKSTLQAGAEIFFSRSLEEFIKYKSIAFPQQTTTGEEDAKRVGVFVGHKLTFNKMSLITQLGFYAYYPYTDYVDQVYNRVGLERKINDDWWTSVSLRAHGANAECVELSIGYRL